MLKNLFRFISAIFVVCLICVSNVVAQESMDADELLRTEDFPLMPIEAMQINRTLPRYASPKALGENDKDDFQDHLDLTEYLGVVGSERDQGNCGSCWVWSGIGCLEGQFNKALMDGQFEGVTYVQNQKFSINFVEGKLIKHPEVDSLGSICNGGNPTIFTDLLSTSDGYNYLVPRANHNADATFSGLPIAPNTTKDLDLIQTTPHVNLDNLELLDVVSDYSNAEQGKIEIIQALNDGYFVQLDFFVYNDFTSFWLNQNEETQYFFQNKPSDITNSGHAVVIVGYDISDPDPSNHYWIIQNSWGVSSKRPKGQMRFNIESGFGANRVMEYVIYKPTFGVDEEICDNLDNDCNTVTDEGCDDLCPENDEKVVPGICGCDESDFDSDEDGTPDCIDECPEDHNLIAPGICGCDGSDRDNDGTLDCMDACPDEPSLTALGVCGCDVSDSDSDNIIDCLDNCPLDKDKTEPGICGCGVADSAENIADDDGDGVINCQEDEWFSFSDVKFGPMPGIHDPREVMLRDGDFWGYLCASSALGELYCMGKNYYGRLGNGAEGVVDNGTLVKLEDLKNISSFSLGWQHACAIQDSKVYCWGGNCLAALGSYNDHYGYSCDGSYNIPKEIHLSIAEPSFVTCSYDKTCVTDKSGTAYCFGSNDAGMFGVDGPIVNLQPQAIQAIYEGRKCLPDGWQAEPAIFNGTMTTVPLSNISQMVMSKYETAVIKDGKLYNYGLHHNMKKHVPAARYEEFKDLVSISKSATDLCGINSSGELYCLDTFTSPNMGPREDYPVQKIDLDNVAIVACGSLDKQIIYGGEVGFAYYDKFGLVCRYGEEGKGTVYLMRFSEDRESHICAVSNGELYCWGRGNGYGQLGSYRVYDMDQPQKVEGVSNVTALAATGGATCYITNGDLRCFGDLLSTLGLNRQDPSSCRLVKDGGKVGSAIHAGDSCEYINGSCGRYSFKNGNYICKACSENIDYEDDIPNCIDNLVMTDVYTASGPDGHVIVNVKDVEGRAIQGEEFVAVFTYNYDNYFSDENGSFDIPLYRNRNERGFTVKARNRFGEVVNGDKTSCYKYDPASYSVLFDYDREDTKILNFTKRVYDNNLVDIIVKDTETNKGIPDVEINWNGSNYKTDATGVAWIDRDIINVGKSNVIKLSREGYYSITVEDTLSLPFSDNGCYQGNGFSRFMKSIPEPVVTPTKTPEETPTVEPTETPSETPEETPTVEPTREPTTEPTVEPTETPSETPEETPTVEPTREPTTEPTKEPTEELTPTIAPTVVPSLEPAPDCPTQMKVSRPSVAKVAGKPKVAVSLSGIDKSCFSGNFIYQLRFVKGTRKYRYTTKKSLFLSPKLSKGKYKISYRILRQVRKKVVVNGRIKYQNTTKAVTGFSKATSVKIK